jgi:hypothetical protein
MQWPLFERFVEFWAKKGPSLETGKDYTQQFRFMPARGKLAYKSGG